MNSEMYRVKAYDFAKAIALAIIGAAIIASLSVINTAVTTPDFNVFTAAWSVILSDAIMAGINAAITTAMSYLTVNFFTTKDGRLFGAVRIRRESG